MSEKVYRRARTTADGCVYLIAVDSEGYLSINDDLEDVINAQNERIAALEGQVADLLKLPCYWDMKAAESKAIADGLPDMEAPECQS